MKLFFPYVENKQEGIFGKGIRRGLKLKYSLLLSSTLPNFPVSNCFDGIASSFCHTNDSLVEPHYLQIHFLDLKLNIVGFAIQNRKGNYWDLLNYDLQGSNNGVNFKTIKSFNEVSSQVCISGKIRTNKVSTDAFFSYIRFLKTGICCNNNNQAFNIGDIDLFGTLVGNISIPMIRRNFFIWFLFVYLIILLQ